MLPNHHELSLILEIFACICLQLLDSCKFGWYDWCVHVCRQKKLPKYVDSSLADSSAQQIWQKKLYLQATKYGERMERSGGGVWKFWSNVFYRSLSENLDQNIFYRSFSENLDQNICLKIFVWKFRSKYLLTDRCLKI